MSEQLITSQAATLAGVAASTWRAYVAAGRAPQPDGRIDGRTPWWYRRTVEQWLRSRPGQGARTDLG